MTKYIAIFNFILQHLMKILVISIHENCDSKFKTVKFYFLVPIMRVIVQEKKITFSVKKKK